jgi:folate-binding protein YgfZ
MRWKSWASATRETLPARDAPTIEVVIVASDYKLLVERVGLVDRSARGKLLLTGAEAVEFLQGQVTNDVEGLTPGQGCYAALLTHKGKMRGDMRVLRGPDWIWLDTEPAVLAPLAHTIRMYGIGRDVCQEDVSDARAILSLVGPDARSALEREPPAEEHGFIEGEHGLYVATDLGVDVICAADRADAVRAALGAPDASEEAAECLRIEAGRPRYGLELDADTIPQEAGLNERAVSFTKGCYVGQETVARLFYKGRPNRRLRGLKLSEPAAHGDTVTLWERQVGTIGSACVSPRHGPIALAVLRREAEPGAEVAVGEEEARAEIVELPFATPSPGTTLR